MPRAEWMDREIRHTRRADELTAGHRARRRRQERHPIEDFLWTYYSVTPNDLRVWHPGANVALLDAGAERAGRRYYRVVPPTVQRTPKLHSQEPPRTRGPSQGDVEGDFDRIDVILDVIGYFAKREATVEYVEHLLRRTLGRPALFGCFGLHEWAMVYRLGPNEVRHTGLPLRIGHDATDRVVESHRIACTHFDAYRFFTATAAPLNTLAPTRDTQPDLEQSGCLHAGMDVYKWAAKLGPIVPGEVLLDAFELARDIREVDMRASPYDVSGYTGADGLPLAPIPIETPTGKREYATLQRGFADRGDALRHRVLAAIDVARHAYRTQAPAPSSAISV